MLVSLLAGSLPQALDFIRLMLQRHGYDVQ